MPTLLSEDFTVEVSQLKKQLEAENSLDYGDHFISSFRDQNFPAQANIPFVSGKLRIRVHDRLLYNLGREPTYKRGTRSKPPMYISFNLDAPFRESSQEPKRFFSI